MLEPGRANRASHFGVTDAVLCGFDMLGVKLDPDKPETFEASRLAC